LAATVIDGKAIAAQYRTQIGKAVAALSAQGHIPTLTVILVGEDPASAVYVRNKIRACKETGIHSELIQLPANTTETDLLARLKALNEDDAVDGILVQFPLPAHLSEQHVLEAISLAKDVDGFHAASVGALVQGQPGLVSCTPLGCMKLLEAAGVPIRGAHAVVVGRSVNVGKPMALLLLQANATVTICHSATQNLASITRQADILVSAVGRVNTIRSDMVKPGATVIDIGINRDESGKMVGDVDFAAVAQIAGKITPVPGGVGPMTIAMLMGNTLLAAQSGHKKRSSES
jgi:methylenetetrahydrofolate dehydrogenase (NADP+)/methenyltetrahydrofolate cyclohydrolase